MVRACVAVWVGVVLTSALPAADDPAEKLSAALRKLYPLPPKFAPVAGDDAVRTLLKRRYNSLHDLFVLELRRSLQADTTESVLLRVVTVPKEMAELRVELEGDPRRLITSLEGLLAVARSSEAHFREMERIGQGRTQDALRAEAERLAVEVHLVRARNALRP